jgi:hypothetical protein
VDKNQKVFRTFKENKSMSSTNRGYDRHKTDYYVTPPKAIEEVLGHWFGDLQGEFHDDIHGIADRPDKKLWLDPCAGGDAKHAMSYPIVLEKHFGIIPQTIDIREDSLAERKENYLFATITEKPHVIITNPPFYIAKAVIEKALLDVVDDGYVVMLLRLNFFGSNERFEFFQQQLPVWSYVHHRRFSFTDDKKTDSIEYMHAVWQKGNCPDFTMLKVI